MVGVLSGVFFAHCGDDFAPQDVGLTWFALKLLSIVLVSCNVGCHSPLTGILHFASLGFAAALLHFLHF
jgi:hypothetical protein